jgi:hypothetical protein
MRKAKNILFRMKLKGNGIVNFDSSDQKFMYNGTNLNNMKTMHDNTSYAKKKFYRDGEKTLYKISISSDCIRHDVFKEDVLFQSPNVINNEHLLYSFIASPASIIRGYLFANEKETLKRKGALCITDAEQTNNAVSTIETFSRSGLKNTDTEKTDNSFYKKEVVGDIEYAAIGNIDLMQLQFISCDQIFDRFSFNPDMYNIYKQFLKTKMPSFDSELGYYQIKGSVVELSEYGFKLNNDNVQILVRELFERLLKLNIRRKGAYAATAELEYKIVYDVIDDTYANEDGWIKITNRKDLAAISFESEDFYFQENTELAKEKRAMIEADYTARKLEGKEKKAAKKEATKKGKKNNE